MPQAIIIIELLIPQRDTHHLLLDQGLSAVFDLTWIPVNNKSSGQSLENMGAQLYFLQQLDAAVRDDHPAAEFPHHRAPSDNVKFQLF